ncbi:cupin domain-containing protein [Maribacter sp. 2308TA10-17]|uniref:cupin domain-containing protein n=1 Tax=Maribacter sp. 2308TA10-17 TaxID=3386276 RepID=UPI0039BC32D4
MDSKIINPEGQFENWESNLLHELIKDEISDALGQTIVFENEQLRVWSTHLQPGGCIPFHRHTTNYSWVCLTDGKAISRYENGKICEITYQRGDLSYYDHNVKKDLVHDLENVGETVLEFVTTEYK